MRTGVLARGGRADWTEGDALLGTLLLENGAAYWAMPSTAEAAGAVAFTRQGCVKGSGRHFAYAMSPAMACEEHRPFFLLFDDQTGRLHGFGVSVYGRASHDWFGRWWLEAPRRSLVRVGSVGTHHLRQNGYRSILSTEHRWDLQQEITFRMHFCVFWAFAGHVPLRAAVLLRLDPRKGPRRPARLLQGRALAGNLRQVIWTLMVS